MLIHFERKLDFDKGYLENNFSGCYHYIDLYNGKITLYNKELALVGNLKLKGFGINHKKQKYQIDAKHKMISTCEATSVSLYDFSGEKLFESSQERPDLSDQEVLDFSVFEGRYLWITTNTSCIEVTCTLHDLQTQQNFSLLITDPLAVIGVLPRGEHVTNIMVLSEDKILLNFSDSQTCMANFFIEKIESSLCLKSSIEDDLFPLCFFDNILLTRSYDVWDGYFRLYNLPDLTVLKDIPFENENEECPWDPWEAFYLENGIAVIKDYGKYLCLDFHKMLMEKLEIRFDEKYQTETVELQYNNNVLFAVNHASKTPVLFCLPQADTGN